MKYKKIFEILEKDYNIRKKKNLNNYKLLDDAFTFQDLQKGIEVILSGKLTMGDVTARFEYEFSNFVNSKYALMVNSGSSANLIASFALTNPKKKNYLKNGDEFIIQALCWSTSLWPLFQAGLKPKFIDVNKNTFNINEDELEKNISRKTKALMLVHILGNCSNIEKIKEICNYNNIFLIEDSCEALGTKYNNKYVGTFGDFGTYSFYYSHQITSGEGGMIVCNNFSDYKIIHELRAHGWDREKNFSKRKLNQTFNFINSGFNLRPLDISAAIGLNQFKRLNKMKGIRSDNKKKIISSLKNSELWDNQFSFLYANTKVDPSWFGLPIIINKKLIFKKKKFLNFLSDNKIETRPILSGNFLKQKSIELYNLKPKIMEFPGTQDIDDAGFFIGLHTKPIEKDELIFLTKKLLSISKI